jgi:hypothetical protein
MRRNEECPLARLAQARQLLRHYGHVVSLI